MGDYVWMKLFTLNLTLNQNSYQMKLVIKLYKNFNSFFVVVTSLKTNILCYNTPQNIDMINLCTNLFLTHFYYLKITEFKIFFFINKG